MKDTSKKVFNYVRDNDGEDMTLNSIAQALDMPAKSVNGCLVSMQTKKIKGEKTPLIFREEVNEAGEDGKTVTVKYIRLTEAGKAFDPDAE